MTWPGKRSTWIPQAGLTVLGVANCAATALYGIHQGIAEFSIKPQPSASGSIHSPWLRKATLSVLCYFHCGEEARAATYLPLLDQFERTLQPDIL